jgi:hypothetical protein
MGGSVIVLRQGGKTGERQQQRQRMADIKGGHGVTLAER